MIVITRVRMASNGQRPGMGKYQTMHGITLQSQRINLLQNVNSVKGEKPWPRPFTIVSFPLLMIFIGIGMRPNS